MTKKLLSLIIGFAALLVAIIPAKADEIEINDNIELLTQEVVDYESEEIVIDCDEMIFTEEDVYFGDDISCDGAISNISDWGRVSNNYVYNKLSQEKKNVWLALDKRCKDVLNGTLNCDKIGAVSTSAFTSADELVNFVNIFKFSNPQYFFLGTKYYVGQDKQREHTYLINYGIYANMQNGTNRLNCKNLFEAGCVSAINKIEPGNAGDAYKVVKAVNDYLCENVTYNSQAVATSHANEENEYTQSAYSAIVLKKSTNLGYAMATQLLCNYLGVDCMSVTSAGHAWNLVKIKDVWYNTDTTWADRNPVNYEYFLKSSYDYEHDAHSEANSASHTIASMWAGHVPECKTSSASTATQAYEPENGLTNQVANVTIAAYGGPYSKQITMSCATTGAKIYYTLKDEMPSDARGYCDVYEGTFTVEENCTIKAIAVKEGMLSSEVASLEVTGIQDEPEPTPVPTNWEETSDGWKYKKTDGSYAKNEWLKVDGKNYHFNADGIMQTGWLKLDNTWYFLDAFGVMQTGWIEIRGEKYLLNEDGSMRLGWYKNDGKWYYFDEQGMKRNSFKRVDDKRYYFDDDGVMQTGAIKTVSGWYCFGSDGAMKSNGWYKVNGYWYYLNDDGKATVNWRKIKNVWYYFDEEAKMCTGWAKDKNRWYYFNASGAMQTGWVKSGSKWYYLSPNGDMKTGWLKDAGKWYYLTESGAMATGWTKVDGVWYYMYGSGQMAADTWVGNYYLSPSGAWTKSR